MFLFNPNEIWYLSQFSFFKVHMSEHLESNATLPGLGFFCLLLLYAYVQLKIMKGLLRLSL